MLKFCANLSMMFTEHPINQRFEVAHRSGFDFIEWLFPYSHDIQTIQSWLANSNLKLVLINSALGDTSRGYRGIGAIPGREDDFRQDFERSLEYAAALSVRNIHVMAGVVPAQLSRKKCEATFVENLAWASNLAQGTEVTLLIEPLNHQDIPNYLHSTCAESFDIIRQVDGEIFLQFDFYHLQITEGNLGDRLRKHYNTIKHIQFSSVPGRHEPKYGEVNVDYLFGLLETLKYERFIGCEYTPKETTEAGLDWGLNWGIKPRS